MGQTNYSSFESVVNFSLQLRAAISSSHGRELKPEPSDLSITVEAG